MFLSPPDLSTTDLYACLRVHSPAVLTALDGAILAVGITRPAAALDMIRDAAPGGLVPTRHDARTFRLRWFAYTHPAAPGHSVTRPAGPTEDGAFPVVIWRAEDQALARTITGTRATVPAMAVAA
ncbi:hypothetical protein OHS58_48480 [Amycolatopsis sp. NBC_00348]|uniref:hypothetical protein n=1 Tax=unclassified Amycolatopsis TaxID=2618356 RepID=UPI002E276AB8|nr:MULTISPECIES: hypothetical protein [unclassified Amycolatopsis]